MKKRTVTAPPQTLPALIAEHTRVLEQHGYTVIQHRTRDTKTGKVNVCDIYYKERSNL